MTLRELREMAEDCDICVIGNKEVPEYINKEGLKAYYEEYREVDNEITEEMWNKEVEVFAPAINLEGFMELWAELED